MSSIQSHFVLNSIQCNREAVITSSLQYSYEILILFYFKLMSDDVTLTKQFLNNQSTVKIQYFISDGDCRGSRPRLRDNSPGLEAL